MKLQYAGLKPVICEHGVSFKNGKEDKFVYLPFTVDILKAIDHTYEQKKVYSHQLDTKQLSPDEILDIIIKFHPDLEKTMNSEIDSYKIHLDKEEAEVLHRQTLSDIEKETYIANLKLMREYKIKKAKKKIFYFN